jgi:hypothetical protein
MEGLAGWEDEEFGGCGLILSHKFSGKGHRQTGKMNGSALNDGHGHASFVSMTMPIV